MLSLIKSKKKEGKRLLLGGLGKSNQSSSKTRNASNGQRQSLDESLFVANHEELLVTEDGHVVVTRAPPGVVLHNNNNTKGSTPIGTGSAGIQPVLGEPFAPDTGSGSKMMRPSSRASGEVLISDRSSRRGSNHGLDRPPSRGASMERPSSRLSATNPLPERPSSRNSNSGRSRQPRLGIGTGPYLFDDDPGIMSEVETSSTRFRRPSGSGGKGGGEPLQPGGSTSVGFVGSRSGRARSASNASMTKMVNIRVAPPTLFPEDDPGIMSEAETSSTARSKRGTRVRNSIPMGALTLNRQQFPKSQPGVQLRGHHRKHQGYQSSSLFEEDPGIMSEAETASTASKRRRSGGKSTLPVVRTPSKTLERPLGLVFLIYRGETKRALLPNEITSNDTVKALFVRSFNKILTMDYMDSPRVKLYIHDGGRDIFYELEQLHEIRDRTILKVFEADSSGRGPAGLGPSGLPPITNTDEYNAASEAAMAHIPGLMPDPEYVDAQYVSDSKLRQKSSASTLPRNAFSSIDPPTSSNIVPVSTIGTRTGLSGSEITLPNTHNVYSSSNTRLSASIKAVPSLGERSKTLGPGFLRCHNHQTRGLGGRSIEQTAANGTKTGLGTRRVESGYVSSPDGNYDFSFVEAKPSRFSSQPRGRYYPGPANTEEAKARMMNMEAQLSQLTGMVEKALKHKKLGKKQVSFDRTVSYSDEKPVPAPQGILVTAKRNISHTTNTLQQDVVIASAGKIHQHFYPSPAPPPGLSQAELQGELKRLHRTTKDLKQEVRVLRRLTQLQSMAMKDLVQDTYLKLREACVSFSSQNGLMSSTEDLELWRIANDEELFSRELNDLLQKIAGLESQVEEVRSGVINKKNKIMLQDVEAMALNLSHCSKMVTQLRQAYPTLETNLKSSVEGGKGTLGSPKEPLVVAEFLRKSTERIDSAWRRSKKLTGTLVTLKRLASVQEQRFHPGSNSSINEISLSPTPSELSFRAASVSSNRESTLDDLLDALQTYSIPPQASSKPPVGLPGTHSSQGTPPQTAKVKPQSHLPSTDVPVSTNSSPAKTAAAADPPDQKPPCPPPRMPTAEARTSAGLTKNPPPPPPRTSSTSTPPSKPKEADESNGNSSALSSSSNSQRSSNGAVSGETAMMPNPSSSSARKTQSLAPQLPPATKPKPSLDVLSKSLSSIAANGHSANGGSGAASSNSSSSSGSEKQEQDVLDTRHQELLTRQRQLQEQYQRLQEMQKKSKIGNNALNPYNGSIVNKNGNGDGHGLTDPPSLLEEPADGEDNDK
eukprot:snap_masked-scaffold841_size89765-processed-gene-0.2 protein:Tk10644 transcript:snap_masked-scaffold841_size89765-processed-gene-0.2-mRNA-1 annotation:"PREDICTED: uncharacterized protein LOC411277 isoform X22"